MIRIIQGDCRTILPTLADNSVHCCVTSPPYYGLRSYGVGAENGELGLEATPDEWIAGMVGVFREVKRVLRPDGTCWVNMGDSYVSTPSGGKGNTTGFRNGMSYGGNYLGIRDSALKPKDLLMMPARLALALQADGWWLRRDIIISKRNPMPESVTDRPTSAHEHLLMLAKSPRYYFDNEAIREPQSEGTHERFGKNSTRSTGTPKATQPGLGIKNNGSMDKALRDMVLPNGRNCRDVWEISTFAFKEAHFATFSPEIPERCIKAGTSEKGCCGKCGKPWVRQTERIDTGRKQKMPDGWNTGDGAHGTVHPLGREAGAPDQLVMANATTGWAASCQCEASVQPCTVLDPFLGSGTTCLVADRLQRHSIGIELNPTYCVMARNRIAQDAGMFAEVAD